MEWVIKEEKHCQDPCTLYGNYPHFVVKDGFVLGPLSLKNLSLFEGIVWNIVVTCQSVFTFKGGFQLHLSTVLFK